MRYNRTNFFFLGALISWSCYALVIIYYILPIPQSIEQSTLRILEKIFFVFFASSSLFYFKSAVEKANRLNLTKLLFRGVVTGVFVVLSIFSFRLVTNYVSVDFPLITLLVESLSNGFITILLAFVFIIWRRLILFRKTKKLQTIWRLFEVLLVGGLLIEFTEISSNISLPIYIIGYALIVLPLIYQTKWVAYLDMRSKSRSVVYMAALSVLLGYVFHHLLNGYSVISWSTHHLFLGSILLFLLTYGLLAVLVIFFNIPTSAVVEQKIRESDDFRKLSQHLPSNESQEEIIDILMNSAMHTVTASTCWFEGYLGSQEKILKTKNITADQIEKIKNEVKEGEIKKTFLLQQAFDDTAYKNFGTLQHSHYQSILALPLFQHKKQIGALVVVHQLKHAFNLEMMQNVTAYVHQASTSLTNQYLMKEFVKNETYRGQLKIAKEVQDKLLPKATLETLYIKAVGSCHSADEVGGDYYDFFEINDHQCAIIIADASGKGTSAAFEIAQMKGIFHGLIRRVEKTDDFIKTANLAISECLNRASFVTVSLFLVDALARKVSYTRAGHCPALWHHHQDNSTQFLELKGLGLGIIRNKSYDNFVVQKDVKYYSEDVLLLYTDGVVEAQNESGEMFGNAKLKNTFENHTEKEPKAIIEGMEQDINTFTNNTKINDDYTLLVIKFK